MKRIQNRWNITHLPLILSCHLKFGWKVFVFHVWLSVSVRVWYQIPQKEMWGRVYPSILTSYIISFFWLQASPHPISFNILQYVRVLFHCTQCTTQYHKIIISHDFHRRRYYILLNRLFMPSSIFVSIRSLVIDTLLLYQNKTQSVKIIKQSHFNVAGLSFKNLCFWGLTYPFISRRS